jgi:curved DNA-binding protein CbpA
VDEVATALNGDSSDGTVDLYELLQVSPQASFVVIRAAYRALARDFHPDVNDTPDAAIMMGRLNAAYAVLSDPERRARYHKSYIRTSRTTTIPRSSKRQSSTWRTGAPSGARNHHSTSSPSPTSPQPRTRADIAQMMGRVVLATALALVIVMMTMTAWLAFTDSDDRSPLMFGARSGASTGAPIVPPGAGSHRPCGLGRVDILSC